MTPSHLDALHTLLPSWTACLALCLPTSRSFFTTCLGRICSGEDLSPCTPVGLRSPPLSHCEGSLTLALSQGDCWTSLPFSYLCKHLGGIGNTGPPPSSLSSPSHTPPISTLSLLPTLFSTLVCSPALPYSPALWDMHQICYLLISLHHWTLNFLRTQ